jgi:hypothetical protein
VYLVYGDNGMRLAYAGEDAGACEEVCARLAAGAAGLVSGFQFVGRQRYELRAYFDRPPGTDFIMRRSRGQLFDFSWHALGADDDTS